LSPIIKVEGISKRYQLGHIVSHQNLTNPFRRGWQKLTGSRTEEEVTEDFWALKDINFEVKQGEVVGIIGKNGAGKSTLLKILSRITDPTEGRIELNGRVSSLLEVGTGFNPELTGRENIFLNGAILGMNKLEIQSKFDEIVAFAEVEKFLDTPVKRYSSGMYVRLAFAVAAHLEPEVLIVDEVLAVGDVDFQKKCIGKMSDVAKKGRTVLFVSHNMAAVRSLCSRAVLLENGVITIDADTEVTITKYLSSSFSGNQSEIELPKNPADSVGEATMLRFTTEDGALQSHFKIGQPWKIYLEFEMYKPSDHVIAGIGLMTTESVGVISYWSNPKNLNKGRYKAEFVCDIPFKACDLKVYVGISANGRNFCYHEGVAVISITTISTGNQPVQASGAGLLFDLREVEIETC